LLDQQIGVLILDLLALLLEGLDLGGCLGDFDVELTLLGGYRDFEFVEIVFELLYAAFVVDIALD
jgi:hypothetical protein